MEKAVVGDPVIDAFQAHDSVDVRESWNRPTANMWRVGAAFFTFMLMGMNDAAPGALLIALETYYDLSYTTVSLLLLSPVLGYMTSSLLSSFLHMRIGQRGIAILGSSCRIVTYTLIVVHPPYPVLVVVFVLSGFATGVSDAAWCAWFSSLQSAVKVQSFLHTFYALGGTISPVIATAMITEGKLAWYTFYYLMVGLAAVELVFSSTSFWSKSAKAYREMVDSENDTRGHTREALKHGVVWLCACFNLLYVGTEVSLTAWTVSFMVKQRHATYHQAGIAGTGFWAGMTAGRACLAFITHRFGERLSVGCYLIAAVIFNFLVWFIPHFVVSAVSVALLGFALGPVFATSIVLQAKLTPQYTHVSGIGFSSAIGMVGAGIFPFAVGALASHDGIRVLQPVVLSLIIAMCTIWYIIPRIKITSRAY